MRACKHSAVALVLLVWFGLSAAVVVWCVSYLFWGEYRTVTIAETDDEQSCVGTWCSDGTWLHGPGTYETAAGPEDIAVLGDPIPGVELELLIGPLPGLALPSRFEAFLPMLLITPSLIGAITVNIAFWKDVAGR
jgi:hypothetical protein